MSEPKTHAEIVAQGLRVAEAMERFDREKYRKDLEKPRFYEPDSPEAQSIASDGRKWQAPQDRLNTFREAIEAHTPYFDRELTGSGPLAPKPQEPGRFLHEESLIESDSDGATHVRPLADSDDSWEHLYDYTEAERFQYAKSAHDSFDGISERETGVCGNPERLQAQWSETEMLKSQSHVIAARIERASRREADFKGDDSLFVPMYRETNYGVYSYYLFSKVRTQAPKFRNSCFLPYMASQTRGKMLKALEAYLECNPFCRMWTFTSGKRVGLGEIRSRVKWLHRQLSKLNHWLKSEFGIEMVFRSTEFGTPEGTKAAGHFDRDESGEPLFHVHAHCLVRIISGKPFSREAWAGICEKVWVKWGFHWDDGKSIKDARELCKYVCKPGALLGLEDWELLRLYRATNSLRLVQPMGQLRDEIRDRKERKMRLEKIRTPDGPVFQEVHDWNCHRDSDDSFAKEYERYDKANKKAESLVFDREGSPEPEIRILAKCVPGFAPGSLVKEPRIVVMATNWNQGAIERHPLVQRLIRRTWEQWQAGQLAAAAIRVHTGAITVPGKPPDSGGRSWFREETGFDDPPERSETFDFYRECSPV